MSFGISTAEYAQRGKVLLDLHQTRLPENLAKY